MKIVWDELKRQSNFAKHGLDFADVPLLDWQYARVEDAKPDADGRKRFKAVGSFAGEIVVVVFSLLGTEAISVISFRQASMLERRKLK